MLNPKKTTIMKKALSMLMLITLAVIYTTSCSAESVLTAGNQQKKQTVQLKTISAVEASGSLKVTIYQGKAKCYVELKGSEKELKNTTTKVSGNKLYIKHSNNQPNNNDKVEVNVYCKNVTDLTSTTGAYMTTSALTGEKVELCAKMGGQIKVGEVTSLTAKLSANVGGKLDVGSLKSTEHVVCEANSGGELDIDKLTAVKTDLSAISGSKIDSHIIADQLKAEAISGSEIELEGTAITATLKAASAAHIKAEELTANHLSATANSAGSIEASAITAEEHADLTSVIRITKAK